MYLEASWLPTNEYGGFYDPGKYYNLARKLEVHEAFCLLADETYPERPTVRSVAEKSRVGPTYAHKIMKEIEAYGGVVDPEDLRKNKNVERGIGCHTLSATHEVFLLSRSHRRNLQVQLASKSHLEST